ncbi:hypothetical protein D9613_004813 [Agrocybe pediades]|uniref:DUF6534 domain-containing protein n=1 Tax=Agrocybe pediades TaxID=84607 RepID=A0A8H4VTG3_9AGAR|nr:hypothetical protein D9613_004813 [Agrocybe pediades]
MEAPDVRLLFGPMLLGVFANMILYGILIVQTYYYYQTFKRDAQWIKYLVLYLFIVETVNTGCDIAIMYEPLINNFGKPEATTFFPAFFASQPIIFVSVSMPIQIFFAWRIKLLTKSTLLAAIVTILAVVSFGAGVYTTALIIKFKEFSRKPELNTPALVWFLTACVADLLITAVLVMALTRRKTGFIATDDILSRIIRTTFHTGIITALFAIGDILCFMILPHVAVNFFWDLSLTKIYSNFLLSNLNSRTDLQAFVGFRSQLLNRTGPPPTVNPRTNKGAPSQEERGGPMHALDSCSYELEDKENVQYGIAISKVVETRHDSDPESLIPATQ